MKTIICSSILLGAPRKKKTREATPKPSQIASFWTPAPLWISVALRGIGGGGGYGYFLQLHDLISQRVRFLLSSTVVLYHVPN